MITKTKNWFIKNIPESDSVIENRRSALVFQYLFIYSLILAFSYPFFCIKLNLSQIFVSTLGLLGAIIPLFLLRSSHSYKMASIVYICLGLLSNTLSIVVFSNGVIDARLFTWFLVHILFAFFTLEKKAGLIIMGLTIALSVIIPFGKELPLVSSFYQNQENTVLFTILSNVLSYIFIYFILDSYMKIFQASDSRIQELIGVNLDTQKEMIDILNQNLALTEEFSENQQVLETNFELLQNLDLKIHNSEEQTLAIHDAAPVGILFFNLKGECVYTNPKATNILGLENASKEWLMTVIESDKDKLIKKWDAFVEEKSNFSADFRINVSEGERWIQARITPIRENGKVASFIGTISNITNAHREKELLYVLFEMVDHTLDIFFVTEKDGDIIYLNKAAKTLLRPSKAQRSLNVFDTNWIESDKGWMEKVTTLKEQESASYVRESKDDFGKATILEVTERLYTFREVEYVITMAKDRTEKMEDEKKIVRNRLFLKNAQSIAKTGSFERNFTTKEYFFSDYLYELFQIPQDTDISRFDFRQYISNEDYEYVNAIFKEKIRKEKSFSLMYRLVNTLGEIIPVHTTVEIVRSKSGAVSKISGTIQNLTEQYKMDKLNRELVQLQSDQIKNKLEIEERTLDLIEKNVQMKEERIRISSVLTGQENERKRLSRELHDGLGQMLTAIKLKVEMIDEKAVNSEDILKYILEIKKDIKNTIFETRKISQDLMPSALEDFGIASAIRILAEDFSNVKGIKVLFKEKDFNSDLPSDIKITLFRIVQEAFSNISKHSNATKCTIELSNKNEIIYLKITDNGSNFRKDVFGSGSGIVNMKERTELLNGQFLINQTQENGCDIQIKIPLNDSPLVVLTPVKYPGGGGGKTK